MSITINGASKRIGLTLSGGGFRAAAFHLGVLRELRARKLLDKIDLISCVSGGSIAGAFLALHWHDPLALDKLDRYLATRSIAVGSVIGGTLDPFHTRLDKLAETYERDLFHGKKLGDLAEGPRIYVNSTNLATGNMFSFIAGARGKSEMGDYELGFVEAPHFPIARAVAASSAFPPVFPPLRLDEKVYKHAAQCDYVTLSDGGVYDNLGINPGLAALNKLDYLLVSDGGKPYAIKTEPTESGALVLKEGLDIMMEQIRGLQFDRLEHRHKAGAGPRPLWFSIDSEEGESTPGDSVFASSIATNLKALKDAERAVLARHGGALVAARIQRWAPELAQ
ncbi:patatin-like phospholipase family protein [Pseudoduganella sp. DS3]|uniref:Patatin-like phospholipase family protein n=1 Tax=Pseudoduganella guangdongensis TaxID=2692179 RepID=A0A6N9HMP9_9BURK|nr:patatin-like phospholipase family protein [Pseudoduganella guangdongensis]MYN04557.1 patatin-like phospholipase family protein [Pseudoduganella guangdongensis]